MFISEFSGKQIEKGVTPVRFVTHKRERIYTHERKRRERDDRDSRDGDRRERFEYGTTPPPSRGWEIVKEISIAPSELEAAKAKYGEGVWVSTPAPAPFATSIKVAG